MVGPQTKDKQVIHTWVCVRVHVYEISHNIGFLCIKRDDKVCRRCTWVSPWFTRDLKKCSKRRRKWLENTIVRCFHPWRYHPTLSSTSQHLFSMLGRRSGAFHTPDKEKNNNHRRLAPQLSSSLSSLSSRLPRAHLHSPPHLFFAARCQATDRKEHHLETSNPQEELAGRRRIRQMFHEKKKERNKTKQWESLSFSLAHRRSKSLNVDLYMQYIYFTCPGLSTDCTDRKRMDVHVEVWIVSSLWLLTWKNLLHY